MSGLLSGRPRLGSRTGRPAPGRKAPDLMSISCSPTPPPRLRGKRTGLFRSSRGSNEVSAESGISIGCVVSKQAAARIANTLAWCGRAPGSSSLARSGRVVPFGLRDLVCLTHIHTLRSLAAFHIFILVVFQTTNRRIRR
ncbi:hypothetical protein LY78DRAFT_656341 [Colletotrichum sublineola]|nr:hypothetical protein LY78DRAFT_656341 [Colletotrichum sublineola]